jgi:hypothetical protein
MPPQAAAPSIVKKRRRNKWRTMKDYGIKNGETILAVRSYWRGNNMSDDWVWKGFANTKTNTILRNGVSYSPSAFINEFRKFLSIKNIKIAKGAWNHCQVERNGKFSKIKNL